MPQKIKKGCFVSIEKKSESRFSLFLLNAVAMETSPQIFPLQQNGESVMEAHAAKIVVTGSTNNSRAGP